MKICVSGFTYKGKSLVPVFTVIDDNGDQKRIETFDQSAESKAIKLAIYEKFRILYQTEANKWDLPWGDVFSRYYVKARDSDQSSLNPSKSSYFYFEVSLHMEGADFTEGFRELKQRHFKITPTGFDYFFSDLLYDMLAKADFLSEELKQRRTFDRLIEAVHESIFKEEKSAPQEKRKIFCSI
jgi:hypothetical protein